MKLMIDIPYEAYYTFKCDLGKGNLNALAEIVAKGTPYEERPQGEWIKVKEERMSVDMSGEIVTRYKCSKCGRVIATFPSKLADYYPFCHCGADMKSAPDR